MGKKNVSHSCSKARSKMKKRSRERDGVNIYFVNNEKRKIYFVNNKEGGIWREEEKRVCGDLFSF